MSDSLSQTTKDLLNKYSIRLKKSLGQNLLIDSASLQRIIGAADISDDDTVIEIGTGTGILTKELAKKAKRVISFETDRKIIEVAKEYLKDFNNIEMVIQDFLDADLDLIPKNTELGTRNSEHRMKLIANLPYYITSPIIEKIIINKGLFSLIILTVQREFAQRITAKPSAKEYGSFTVFVNYHLEPGIAAYIPKSAFLPQPEVGSAVISLIPRENPPVDIKDEVTFFKVVRASFGQRRKTLKRSLETKFTKEQIEKAFSATGIDPKRRGETLSIKEFGLLADAFV